MRRRKQWGWGFVAGFSCMICSPSKNEDPARRINMLTNRGTNRWFVTPEQSWHDPIVLIFRCSSNFRSCIPLPMSHGRKKKSRRTRHKSGANLKFWEFHDQTRVDFPKRKVIKMTINSHDFCSGLQVADHPSSQRLIVSTEPDLFRQDYPIHPNTNVGCFRWLANIIW
jgi:hypothetical protein